MDAALLQLRRYQKTAIALPTEAGLYQATIKVPSSIGRGLIALRPMADLGIDFNGRWFEVWRGQPRLIDPADILLDTLRAVDWSVRSEHAVYIAAVS